VEKEYYIPLKDGTKVPVTKAVYYAYKRPVWREKKNRRERSEYERSLEAFMDSGYEPASKSPPIVGSTEDKLLLYSALAELTDDERYLIEALYFQGKSERNLGEELGISCVAVHKRKNKILAKLNILLSNC